MEELLEMQAVPGLERSLLRKISQILMLWVTLAYLSQPSGAQILPNEQAARAAMVFNFLRFAEFPEAQGSDTARIRLCVSVGDSLQAEALASLSGRTVRGRVVEVYSLSKQYDNCEVIYVDSRQRWQAAEYQRDIHPALTIGAYPSFARDGGIIEIAIRKEGNRFDINLAALRRINLHISPNLLRLARYVYE